MRIGRHFGRKRPNHRAVFGGGTPTPTPQAAALWTPANASAGTIKGWWDISDYANRSVTSGAIDSVNDKSGNGLTLFGGAGDASGTKPTFSIGGFAQESASFDGSHNVLCSSGTLSQAQPFTLYQSFYPFLVGGANQTAFDGGNSILWRPTQGGNPLVFAGSIDLTRPSLSGQPQVVRLRYSGGNGSLGINGGADSTKTAGANGISAGAIRLGDSPSNGAPFRGLIRETVLINGDVTAGSDTDLRMVGYLAWAGGSWSFLDSGHTYRYAAPKVGITAAKANIPWASTAWIPHGASGDYHATNICDFNVVDHPSDPTKLVLYATGQAEPPSTGTCSIGRWIIDKTNPTASPTFDRVVLVASGADAGGGGVRLGSVIQVGSTYYMYYCSQSGTNSIFLATSTDSVNFTKAGAAIIVPSGDEENIGEPTIWWEDGVATIIYTYRTAGEVLPGYRFATSNSLTGSFTKGALPDGTKDILRRAVSANNNALQLEAHQIVKRNGRYYLFCEMGGNDSDATPYRIYLASCDTISGRYKWEKLVIAENPAASASSGGVGGGPKYHVATPCLFTANGTDYLIYEGAPDQATPYAGNRWNGYISAVAGDLFDLA